MRDICVAIVLVRDDMMLVVRVLPPGRAATEAQRTTEEAEGKVWTPLLEDGAVRAIMTYERPLVLCQADKATTEQVKTRLLQST